VCTGACKKALSSTSYNEQDGEIMCTTCHRKHASSSVTGTLRTDGNTAAAAATTAAAADDDDDDDDGDKTQSQWRSHVVGPNLHSPFAKLLNQFISEAFIAHE